MLKGFNDRDKNFYNVTSDIGAVAMAIGSIANLKAQQISLVNTIASRRTQLELAKSDLQKNIESTCGKQPIGCGVQVLGLRNDCKNWDACRDEAVQYQRGVQEQILQMQRELADLEATKVQLDAQIANDNKSLESDQLKNENKKNWIIGISIGVGLIVFASILIYATKKNK
jgi:hypothetical protein